MNRLPGRAALLLSLLAVRLIPIRRLVLVLGALLIASPAAAGAPWCARAALDAQPRCKKGCPCGNACISCSKTCRMSAPSPPEERPATARPLLSPPSSMEARALAGVNTGPWFGSSANRFYFTAQCPIVKLLAVGDQVVLPDSASAERVGFRRLVLPGC